MCFNVKHGRSTNNNFTRKSLLHVNPMPLLLLSEAMCAATVGAARLPPSRWSNSRY